MDTRLQKLERGDYDAVVLAKAGLDRLGWSGRISEVISVEICLPAVGQGALGIESREDVDAEVGAALAKLDHSPTRTAVTAERALLAELEGGCQVPLGAWARMSGGELLLEACIAAVDGTQYIRRRSTGVAENAASIGRNLAQEMIAAGGAEILQQAGRNVAR